MPHKVPERLKMAAYLEVNRAEIESLLQLVEIVAERSGITSVQGVPLRTWFLLRFEKIQKEQLAEMWKSDPAWAAELQVAIQSITDTHG